MTRKNTKEIFPREKDSKGRDKPLANGYPPKNIVAIGKKMHDGTIYAGLSPSTGNPMYAAPTDAPRSMDVDDAAAYAKDLNVGGKKDFRVPTIDELNVLFANREKGALKGTFNQSSDIYGIGQARVSSNYRSATRFYDPSPFEHFGQDFCTGELTEVESGASRTVRCVR